MSREHVLELYVDQVKLYTKQANQVGGPLGWGGPGGHIEVTVVFLVSYWVVSL